MSRENTSEQSDYPPHGFDCPCDECEIYFAAPPSEQSSDRRVVACNYTEATKIATAGAKAYLVLSNPGGGHDRVMVLVRSRGGRWVQKWESMKRLDNFRATTLPREHPRYGDLRLWDYAADEMAEILTRARERSF